MKEKHVKLIWVCDVCNWVTISDSREHHVMDNCRCEKGACGVDLEFYSCRFSGRPRTLAVLEQGNKWKVKRQKTK